MKPAVLSLVLVFGLGCIIAGLAQDPLPSWNDTAPKKVIGSAIKTRYELREARPVLLRLPEVDFIDDKAGKPVGIQRHIGRRPLLAFGNSDGDFEMLEWTTSAAGAPRMGLLLHHTDAAREWAYDRESHVGRLARALDEAPKRGWLVVDMQKDWSRVYPGE